MKLEDEIGQSRFRNQKHKLAVNIIYTFNWLSSYQLQFLKQFDITYQQFNVLRILRGQSPNPASVKLIRERMLDKMSDASRIVEKLRMKGLAERHIAEHDRRECKVFITSTGLELLKKIDQRDTEADALFAALSTQEINQLNELLDKLRG